MRAADGRNNQHKRSKTRQAQPEKIDTYHKNRSTLLNQFDVNANLCTVMYCVNWSITTSMRH